MKRLKRLKKRWLNLCVRLYLKYPRLVGFLSHPNASESLSFTAFLASTGVK